MPIFSTPGHCAVRPARRAWRWTLALCAAAFLPAAQANDRLDRALDEMDRLHDLWSDSLRATVERFDRLFGDERFDAEADETRISVSTGLYLDHRDGVRLKNRFRLRLALPNLQKRALLFIEDAFETDRVDRLAVLEEAARESRPLTGLRLVAQSMGKTRLTADIGARLGGDPQVVGRVRLSFVRAFEVWRRRLNRDWLFLELGPGIELRQEDDYEPNPFGVLRLEVLFGG